mgnify:CR=1 FL=1
MLLDKKSNKPTRVSYKILKDKKKVRISKQNYLGDIIISYNFINKPKSLNTKLFREKVTKIFIHGFLHLLGFDHIKFKDYKKMFNEEKRIFKYISNYYNSLGRDKCKLAWETSTKSFSLSYFNTLIFCLSI